MPDLDSASIIIGELKGQFAGLEKYIHNQFHDVRGHMQTQFGFLETILKELKELRDRDVEANAAVHHELEARVEALEARNHRTEGVSGTLDYIFKSPLIGWLVGAATAFWAFATGKVHL